MFELRITVAHPQARRTLQSRKHARSPATSLISVLLSLGRASSETSPIYCPALQRQSVSLCSALITQRARRYTRGAKRQTATPRAALLPLATLETEFAVNRL